jgi:iron(III) transport system substrate-binding protein
LRRLRLYVWLIAFAGVLFAPFVLRILLSRQLRPVMRESSGLELRIITPHNQDIRRVFEAAFSDWHRDHYGQAVRITYLSPGGTNEITRYLKDLYGSYRDGAGALVPEEQVSPGIELVWGGGDYVFERDFKPFLKPMALDPALLAAAFPDTDLAGVALLDPQPGAAGPRWVGVVLSSFGLIFAPDFYDRLQLPLPETWSDLARPELQGLLAMADPTRSGSAATVYMMVLQRAMAAAEQRWLAANPAAGAGQRAVFEESPGYLAALGAGWKEGMRQLLLMAANARYFSDSGSRPCVDVGDAESAAGMAIDFFARVFQEQIGRRRISYHAPRGATAITPDPIGILYGTHGAEEQLATRFVEFLLSPEAQRLWNLRAGESPYIVRSLRRMPVRRDVYSDRTGWADDDDPFELAAGFNMRQRWMRQMGRLIPIWAAAWIDTKPDLDRAYSAVLQVKDAERQHQLLFTLSDLPVELDDVTSKPANVSNGRAEPKVDARLQAARDRMGWSERFRQHYADVLHQAKGAG